MILNDIYTGLLTIYLGSFKDLYNKNINLIRFTSFFLLIFPVVIISNACSTEEGKNDKSVNDAINYIKRGRHAIALDILDNVLRRDPFYTKAFLYRGYIYRIKNECNKAIHDFKSIVGQGPGVKEYYHAHYQIALCYMNYHNYNDAIKHLEKAVELNKYRYHDGSIIIDPGRDKKVLNSYNALGECYFNLENIEKARQAFNKALEIDPENDFAKIGLNKAM